MASWEDWINGTGKTSYNQNGTAGPAATAGTAGTTGTAGTADAPVIPKGALLTTEQQKAANIANGVVPQRGGTQYEHQKGDLGVTPSRGTKETGYIPMEPSGQWEYTGTGWVNKNAGQSSGGTAKKKEEEPLTPAADMWQSSYAPSQNVTDALAYLNQQEQAIANKGPYGGSPYDQDIASAYGAIMGRGPFSYNVNADALYQQYRDLYAENGRQASLNAQGQAAGLTGGYGNSYAAAAGNAAYDQYMTQLNDRALDLYDRARQRWLDEGDRLQTQYGMARDMGELDYSRWVDDWNRLQQERNYAYGKYGDEFNRDYSMYKDEQQLAYDNVLAMIQRGVTPSAQMRRNAGITDEDYELLKKTYKKKSSGGGAAYRGPSVTAGDRGYDPNVIPESNGTTAAQSKSNDIASFLNQMVDQKLIDPEVAITAYAASQGITLPEKTK